MESETKISEPFAQAIISATADIAGAVKDSTNPHFRSSYADLESVIAAVKPALIKNGLTFLQRVHPGDKVRVETIAIYKTGEIFSCGILEIPLEKLNAQGVGSAITYARRYALSTAFGVPQVDDDGEEASSPAPIATKPAPKKPTPVQTKAPLAPTLPTDRKGLEGWVIATKCSFHGKTIGELFSDPALWKAVELVVKGPLRKNLNEEDLTCLNNFIALIGAQDGTATAT